MATNYVVCAMQCRLPY